jgi:hypothetical protein
MQLFHVFAAAFLTLSLVSYATAAWQVSLSSVFEYDHTIAEDDSPVSFSSVSKPPFLTGTAGPWAVDTFTNSSVSRSEGFGIEANLMYIFPATEHLDLSVGFSLGLLNQRIIYDISYWNHYHGFNPLTLGYGGPPILIGRSEFEVNSIQSIPSLTIGATYALSERLSVAMEFSVGEAFASYEHHDFYNRVHQRTRVIPPDQQESLRSTEDDWIGRQSIALAIEYQLSDHWSLNLSQAFVRNENYQLTNWAESNASIHGMTIRIQNQTQLQTALGVTYQF